MKKPYSLVIITIVIVLTLFAANKLLRLTSAYIAGKAGQQVTKQTVEAQLKAITEAPYDSLEPTSAKQQFTTKLPRIIAVSLNNGILEVSAGKDTAVSFMSRHFGQVPQLKNLTSEGYEIVRIDPVDYENEKRVVTLPTTQIHILNVATGVGSLSVDLRKVAVTESNLSVGIGTLAVTATDKMDSKLSLANGLGSISVSVPEKNGFIVTLPQGLQLNSSLAKLTDAEKNVYTSINYDTAKIKTKIDVANASGFNILTTK